MADQQRAQREGRRGRCGGGGMRERVMGEGRRAKKKDEVVAEVEVVSNDLLISRNETKTASTKRAWEIE